MPDQNALQKQITIQLNYFGPLFPDTEIEKILDSKFNALQGTPHEAFKNLLELFFEVPITAITKEILARFCEVTTQETSLPIAPRTDRIYDKLLRPLKSAKKNYCFGDYTATIAVAGIVAEMLSVMIWEINDVMFHGKRITQDDEKKLFGRTFEKLGQERRIEVLRAFNFISEDQLGKLETIRQGRVPYLHLWSASLSNEKEDAKRTLVNAFVLFRDITGIAVAANGQVSMNPSLMRLFPP